MNSRPQTLAPFPLLGTAFLEGLSVLVVEIAGARAVAPYFGASLRVWTSQITATLLFLALGYALGGRLSRAAVPSPAQGRSLPAFPHFPRVFWGAGLWLGLFPWIRVSVLGLCAPAGVALGSFLASALLYGPALLCLGAVSPLLIQGLERSQGDGQGGSAAGAVFFTNTLGGLFGGWLTALVLIPHVPLRLALMGTGLLLALAGSLWAWPLRKGAAPLALPLILAASILCAPKPALTCPMGGSEAVILYSHPTSVGLLQVMDIQNQGYSRAVVLTVDGITQGGMERTSGLTAFEFTEYQAYLSWRHHPRAKRALLLGLGSGLLAKQLRARGLDVDVAEIEPRMAEVARGFFSLPDDVRVHTEDARAFLNGSTEAWDLVFLDAFAGETTPWYLLTREGLRSIRDHLAPGGRLLVNLVTRSAGSPGLDRVEAGILSVFPSATVYVDTPQEANGVDLVNACLVAGADLKPSPLPYPGKAVPLVRERTLALEKRGRPAKAGGFICTDDFSDLDQAESDLRLEWRKAILEQEGPQVLGTDMRLSVVKHEVFEGPGGIADWARERGHSVRVVELSKGEALPALGDFDALVLMGGPMSVNEEDRYAWLKPEKALVREALAGGKKILGVCLGSQMIASALGATVRPNAFKEIGWFPIESTAAGKAHPWWGRMPSTLPVFHWHGETFDLPPGAELLARSSACEHQVYAIGDRVLALQCHLEVNADSLSDMVALGRDEIDLSQPFIQNESVLLGQPEAFARLLPLFQSVMDAWAGA